jgi:hypothetical protein
MLTLTLSIPWRREGVDHVQRHADVPHQDLHRRLRVLVLEEDHDAALGGVLGGLPDPVHEARPRLPVRRLERVVVALDPRPDDHLRAALGGEVDRLPRQPQGVLAEGVVGRDERALAEARVQVQPARDAVDPVPVERLAHLVEVVGRELLRVVELVVVDQVAEPLDRGAHPLRGGAAAQLGLVASRVEPGGHVPEGPDAETRPHAVLLIVDACATASSRDWSSTPTTSG